MPVSVWRGGVMAPECSIAKLLSHSTIAALLQLQSVDNGIEFPAKNVLISPSYAKHCISKFTTRNTQPTQPARWYFSSRRSEERRVEGRSPWAPDPSPYK